MHKTRTSTLANGQQYAWIGYAMGIACMAALFIAGLVTGTAQMMVMACSLAAMLGALWASTTAAARAANARRTHGHLGA
ncbi:hypothetical protein [Arthrobacter sp.]|uniref:hypothetical protein n=1 Tax=Arthrobacter sp. TaxID=1667 RepID=UPI003A8EF1E4